jgi:hypothetical protein
MAFSLASAPSRANSCSCEVVIGSFLEEKTYNSNPDSPEQGSPFVSLFHETHVNMTFTEKGDSPPDTLPIGNAKCMIGSAFSVKRDGRGRRLAFTISPPGHWAVLPFGHRVV